MNEFECDLALDLAEKKVSKEGFLKLLMRGEDPEEVVRQVLAEAIDSKVPDHIECALIVGFNFGFTQKNLPLLMQILSDSWHFRHEDAVDALATLRSPMAVEALYRATLWVPEYLDFDDSRALASKAIWALGAIDGSEATDALLRLAESGDSFLSQCASEQLKRRDGGVLPK